MITQECVDELEAIKDRAHLIMIHFSDMLDELRSEVRKKWKDLYAPAWDIKKQAVSAAEDVYCRSRRLDEEQFEEAIKPYRHAFREEITAVYERFIGSRRKPNWEAFDTAIKIPLLAYNNKRKELRQITEEAMRPLHKAFCDARNNAEDEYNNAVKPATDEESVVCQDLESFHSKAEAYYHKTLSAWVSASNKLEKQNKRTK